MLMAIKHRLPGQEGELAVSWLGIRLSEHVYMRVGDGSTIKRTHDGKTIGQKPGETLSRESFWGNSIMQDLCFLGTA